MTIEELQKENEKLTTRLQKAVSVFNEQKETIKRLTEERDAAVAKTADADKQDQLFFEQEQEITTLKASIEELNSRITVYTDQEAQYTKTLAEKTDELDKLTGRLKKAADEYSKQKQALDVAVKQNQALVKFVQDVQDGCAKAIQEMQ